MTCFVALITFFVPVLGVWAPLGLAPLLGFAAIVAVMLFRGNAGVWPKLPALSLMFLSIFALWSTASLGWAPDLEVAGRKLASLILLIVLGLAYLACAVRANDTPIVSGALIAGFTMATVTMLIERYAGAPVYILLNGEFPPHEWPNVINRFNRGMTVIALLAWPVAGAARRFHPLAGIVVIGSVAGAGAGMYSDAAVLALVLGGICYGAIWIVPKYPVATLLGGIAAVSVMLIPAAVDRIPIHDTKSAMKESLPESAYHRLLIWKFTDDRISDRPILGWGFNASRAIPDGAKAIDKNLPGLPLHPHSAALQWRLELGLPGAILGSILVGFLFVGTRRYKDRNDRAMAAATIASGLTIACLSYGAWQSWWIAALILVAASIPVASPKNGSTDP